ncbi:uncharacterized protein with HXXEE motif [Murinocardiopsis flavida]|uniref:Uncharacterized protein with HXXEE motif n=1 Tax=Murinocardiopsis flavida TaxID=645275 RepID=A0A2P8DU08_9ACTN|nr:HXXEE domain-containing protein [Murinocardiopsis flavida]PSL00707.1 uncharacterized protein with HXXEE motif [Murinocardiopsis flavida]
MPPPTTTTRPVPPAATWGLLAAFVLHDLEELWTMAEWRNRRSEELRTHYPWLPERATALLRTDQEHMATAIGLMGLITAAAAADGARTGGRSGFYQWMLTGFGLHAGSHLALSAAWRGYTPGVVTAPLVVAPFSAWALRTLHRHGVLRPMTVGDTVRSVAMAPALIVGVHAAASGIVRARRALRSRRAAGRRTR